MADKEITSLATAGAVTGTEKVHIVQSGNSRQTDLQKIIDTLAEPLGKIRLNAQTVNYTLVLADAGKKIEVNSGSTKTITIPTNATVAFATETYVKVRRYGAGEVTVTGAAGVTINGVVAGSFTIPAQFGEAELYKRGTDEWVATVPGSGIALLNSGSVAAAATLDIVLTSYSAYRGFIVELYNFIPATDNVDLWMRTSTDGGSTFGAAGSDYAWALDYLGLSESSSSDSKMQLNQGVDSVGNGSSEGISTTVKMMFPAGTAINKRIIFQSVWNDDGGNLKTCAGGGERDATADVDALRFLFSSGNITSGSWALYGLL